MEFFRYVPGTIPLLISIPHAGTHVPAPILERFTQEAKQLPDTDWHVDRLYDFARELGAHMLIATHSRFVVDLNRAPDGSSLYPGKFTTGLCPETLFSGAPIYTTSAPDEAETQSRVATYWKPYHDTIQSLLSELKTRHGRAVLFDAHSICSHMPSLFEGRLPDLNFGTADGAACDSVLSDQLATYADFSPFTHVMNGRFKGGYITRNYGNPAQGISAVQLELAQVNYMQEQAPFGYDEAKAMHLQQSLRGILNVVAQWSGHDNGGEGS